MSILQKILFENIDRYSVYGLSLIICRIGVFACRFLIVKTCTIEFFYGQKYVNCKFFRAMFYNRLIYLSWFSSQIDNITIKTY